MVGRVAARSRDLHSLKVSGMIPMMAVNKARVYMIAFICLTGSLAGAVIAYFIGLFLFESIGILILETLHMNDAFYNFVSDITD